MIGSGQDQIKIRLSLYFCAFKEIYKNKLKFKDKPWITPGLQKSIAVKSQFLSKF